MNALRVVWPDVPAAVRAEVEPRLLRWLAFLPLWVERLIVEWEAEPESNYSLAVTVHPEYRKANLHVFPGHLNEPDDAKDNCALHELVHVPIEPMCDAFRNLLRATTKEGDPLRAWAEEEWRKAKESAVCDITSGIIRIADSKR